MSTYKIELPVFSGPLDLLLHLIDRNELDITALSLSKVTEQYLAQVEQFKEDRIEHLIDFLVVGARLVLIKSRALLPQTPNLILEEEEEDPAEALARQLRQYRRFKTAAQGLLNRYEEGLRSYLRVAPPPKIEPQLDLTGVTVDGLIAALHMALKRSEKREASVSVAVRRRTITVEKQMERLRQRVKNNGRLFFTELLSNQISRIEISVTLLAVLELIKRYEIAAHQPVPFGPIEIVGLD